MYVGPLLQNRPRPQEEQPRTREQGHRGRGTPRCSVLSGSTPGRVTGYLQVGEGGQVVEGAFGHAGDVVAVEGPEAEAQARRLAP